MDHVIVWRNWPTGFEIPKPRSSVAPIRALQQITLDVAQHSFQRHPHPSNLERKFEDDAASLLSSSFELLLQVQPIGPGGTLPPAFVAIAVDKQ